MTRESRIGSLRFYYSKFHIILLKKKKNCGNQIKFFIIISPIKKNKRKTIKKQTEAKQEQKKDLEAFFNYYSQHSTIL